MVSSPWWRNRSRVEDTLRIPEDLLDREGHIRLEYLLHFRTLLLSIFSSLRDRDGFPEKTPFGPLVLGAAVLANLVSFSIEQQRSSPRRKKV